MQKKLVIFFTLIFSLILLTLSLRLFQSYKPENKTAQLQNVVEEIRSSSISPKIIAAGDISCGNQPKESYQCQQEKTAQIVLDRNPDLVLTLGDHQYPIASYDNLLNYYDKTWGKFKRITRPTLGNHDYSIFGADGFFEYFKNNFKTEKSGYYSFNIGSWHLISLNSNCYEIAGCTRFSAQYKWLESDLESNLNKCTLVYYHHPRFSSGIHGNSNFMQDVWELLAKNQVDIVLNGHDHVYERFAPLDFNGKKNLESGIRQFIVGTGGRNLYEFGKIHPGSEVRNNKSFGVLELTLNPESFEWRFLPIQGQTFSDSGVSNCN